MTDQQQTPDPDPARDEAALARVLGNLPDPVELRRLVNGRVTDVVGHHRAGRRREGDDGDRPLGPDRVRPLTLQLARIYDGLHGVAAAFESGSKLAQSYLAEEQIEAHGEQSGIPNDTLKVLDDDGSTVSVRADVVGEWSARDVEPVLRAAAVVTLAERSGDLVAHGVPETPEFGELLESVLVDALTRLTAAGKFAPQVTKVKALADLAARVDPDVAAAARDTMYRTNRLRGTKIERKSP